MALRWSLLLALMPLLAAEEMEKDVTGDEENLQETGCPKPRWDPSLRFVPERKIYGDKEELTLSCLTGEDPPLAVIRCALTAYQYAWEVKDMQGTWHRTEMRLTCTGTCQKPLWDKRVTLVPRKGNYTLNEELSLSCPEAVKPSFTKAKCAREFLGVTSGKPVFGVGWWGRNGTGTWTRIEEPVACVVKCSRPQWDPDLRLIPEQDVYEEEEEVKLSCPEGSQLPFQQAKCVWRAQAVATGEHKGTWIQRNNLGRWVRIARPIKCIKTCQRPLWDSALRLAPHQEVYTENKEVKLSCPEGFKPSFTHVRCAGGVQALGYSGFADRTTWLGKNSTGAWIHIEEPVLCLEMCQKPSWDTRLRLAPDQEEYSRNEEVMLSCPEGFEPSFTHIKCSREVQSISTGKPVYRGVWMGKGTGGAWTRIHSKVECVGKCQKPQWDPRLIFDPERASYILNDMVTVRCPEGYWPPPTKITCVQPTPSQGSPTPQRFWYVRRSTGRWEPLDQWQTLTCVEAFQVVPGTLEVSTISIKLNWTCSPPDACQRMQATCRLAGPSSPPCEAEEVTGQEILHGQNGTFTCNHLQPFTDYSVTISVPPSTILFTWVIRTEETVPEKPERLWLDASTGTLRWQALPSCKGEILGYQLNVTTRGPQDGGFLQVERLMLSSSVTEHPLPAHGPGTSYTVAVRGLTAAGAGAALLEEFQTNSSETPDPPDVSSRLVRDISPSRGTAVLPLRPITWVPEAGSEHQLLVAATHNGTALEGACSGELQPFNASRPPDAYVAAVLNLTAPTAFVLGDGTHGHGFHNAPLRPGWDYTALLRLVRRSQQEETFTCVCYSFSVVAGQPPGSWTGIVTGVVVLLLLLLLFAGIVWFVLSRRRKAVPIKAKENN